MTTTPTEGKCVIFQEIILSLMVSIIKGCNIKTVRYKNHLFTMYDIRMAGSDWEQGKTKQGVGWWRNFYEGTHGLIYVVDSNDRERIGDARHQLMQLVLAV